MAEQTNEQNDGEKNDDFLNAAQDGERGLVAEFVMFMAEN